MDKSIKIKLNASMWELTKKSLMQELEQFRYDPYRQIVSNRVEDTLGYYERERLNKKIAEVMNIKESDLGMSYNPFYEIGKERAFFESGMLREPTLYMPHSAQIDWYKETKKETPPMITLTLNTLTPEAVNVLHAIGAYSLNLSSGEIKLTLEDGPYKQFDPHGVIFTTDGRTLDPSFRTLSLSPRTFIMRHYEKVQHDGGEIDKHIVRRDAHYVVFPVGTERTEGWSADEYTLPGGAVITIDTHGYLYMQTRPLAHGDDVIVTIQGEEIEGTYDKSLMDGVACFVDLEMEDDGPTEYVKVLQSRVRHA